MESLLGHCATCARPFHDRKSWRARAVSHEVKYCSASCRRAKPKAWDRALEERLSALLAEAQPARQELKSVVERLGLEAERERQRLVWAMRRLAVQGLISLYQEGRAVEPGSAKGPLALELSPEGRAAR